LPRISLHLVGLVVIAQLIGACTVGPAYRRPNVNPPRSFRGQDRSASNESLADLPWWSVFRDKALQELIREALSNSFDLRIAVTRIDQARAQLAQVRSQGWPRLAYQSGGSRQSGAELLSVGGTATPVLGVGRVEANSFTVQGSASWELDLWGRIRRQTEAGKAQLTAAEEARRAVIQNLVSQVAEAYFNLRELDSERAISVRNRDAFAAIVTIFKQQKAGGIASDLEIARAVAMGAQIAADVPHIEQQILQTENALSLLLGRHPGSVPRGASLTEQYSPPAVPAGVPSALLNRRPDVRQAEQQLIAANAEIGVATANFLPAINLTAGLGMISPQLGLLTSGGGNFWSFGGGITGPLLQGGLLAARYHEAKARWEEAKLQYQRAALSAFTDVSNALIARRKMAQATEQHTRAAEALRLASNLARERYTGGVSTYIELLDAQQQLYPAEINLARARLQQMLTLVQLYKALGGGWR
jgi:multidrug efflux system outer membrane protein